MRAAAIAAWPNEIPPSFGGSRSGTSTRRPARSRFAATVSSCIRFWNTPALRTAAAILRGVALGAATATRDTRRRWSSLQPLDTCGGLRISSTHAISKRWRSATWLLPRGFRGLISAASSGRAVGGSPHAYLLTRRLERAAALLRTTDRPFSGRRLLLGRAAEPWIVHHQLHPHLRRVANRLPQWRWCRPAYCAPMAARNAARLKKTCATGRIGVAGVTPPNPRRRA
jgi:hypothetical protein